MNMNSANIVILIFMGGFLLLGLLTSLTRWIMALQRELRYLNMEIRRTVGQEQRYYRKARRRLLFPWLYFFRR